MQEIDALEIELKRLKEVKAINKEFRRFACMPIGVMSKPCPHPPTGHADHRT